MKKMFYTIFFITGFVAIQAWAEELHLNIRNPTQEMLPFLEKKYPAWKTQNFSKEKLDQVLKDLQTLPGILRLEAFENKGTFEIQVYRRSRIKSINFNGNYSVSNSDLQPFLELNQGDLFQKSPIQTGKDKIEDYYRQNGFLRAQVKIVIQEIEDPKDKQIIVDVNINEGRQTKVTDVTFQGYQFDPFEGRKARKPFLGPYLESRLQGVEKSLKEDFRKKGYLKLELRGPEAKFSADDSEVQLIYTFENPQKYELEFRGNKNFSASDIEDDILVLKEYSSTNPNLTLELTEKIKQAYYQVGYARFEIATEELPGRASDSRRIIFKINEGPKIRVQSIQFRGSYSQDPAKYEKLFFENAPKLLYKRWLNKQDIDPAVKSFTSELQNQGFLQAQVLSSRIQYNAERTAVTLVLQLNEGPLTVVTKVDWQGANQISSAELAQQILIKEHEPLKLFQIETSVKNLKTFYRDHGFLEVEIIQDPEKFITYNEEGTLAEVHFHIVEGPLVRVGSIILDGNTFTQDYVLLRNLEFKTGDILTPTNIDESISRLQKSGLFNSVEIKTLEEKTMISDRTVVVKVSERNPGIFNMGVGATNEHTATARGFIGVAYRNLYGTGRGVSIRLEGNYNPTEVKFVESKVVLGYFEPFLFSSRLQGRINVTRASTVTNFDIRQASILNQQTYSVEKIISSHITGTWDVWSLATYKDFSLVSPPLFQESSVDIASTGLTFEFDYRDNPFNTSTGNFVRLTGEYGNPGFGSSKTIDYSKATATYNIYNQLWKTPIVWANSFRVGFLKNTSNRDDGGVPYDKKGFILGGRSTIRGFEAGTSDVFPSSNDLGTQTYLLQTQAQMGLFKSEIRFPLFGNWEGAVFYDGGYVQIANQHFDDYYRDSTGFGFHYLTPVGPLNLEFAWKLDRKEGESPWRFHLSIGTF